jgi:hypothetical protein
VQSLRELLASTHRRLELRGSQAVLEGRQAAVENLLLEEPEPGDPGALRRLQSSAATKVPPPLT